VETQAFSYQTHCFLKLIPCLFLSHFHLPLPTPKIPRPGFKRLTSQWNLDPNPRASFPMPRPQLQRHWHPLKLQVVGLLLLLQHPPCPLAHPNIHKPIHNPNIHHQHIITTIIIIIIQNIPSYPTNHLPMLRGKRVIHFDDHG
jgi:hypothetical protein